MKKNFNNLLVIGFIAIVFTSCQKEPTVAFTPSATSVIVDEIINFTNNSVDASNYLWDFGDGSTSEETNPSHSYIKVGTYTVTLTAYSKNGKLSNSEVANIIVVEDGDIMFWVSDDICPVTVEFNGTTKTITTSYSSSAPTGCGADGCATFENVPVGTYDFTANSAEYYWNGQASVYANGCVSMHLTLTKAVLKK
ncbi:MAG: PKD domain-containing protein [Bacteroidales bacterium]|nr:PKD domain-containing protein [Bacteroidales bacterium]MDD3152415.1 PKD domain-containing protein [Bacteroidales bacterium]MDD3915146.1 PKD domain-containing protein [Bacteroidales bacterium]MDD4634905.1 PKD domain-containing protein [Bacteroidales bacterium]